MSAMTPHDRTIGLVIVVAEYCALAAGDLILMHAFAYMGVAFVLAHWGHRR
jgi:hypothetical protein